MVTTIKEYNADVCIVLEANADMTKFNKVEAWKKNMFSDYNIETKIVDNQHKARIALVVKKNVPYHRCKELGCDDQSSIVIKIKET